MGEGEHDAPFKHYHICLLNIISYLSIIIAWTQNTSEFMIIKFFKPENYEVSQQLHVCTLYLFTQVMIFILYSYTVWWKMLNIQGNSVSSQSSLKGA